MKVATSYDVKYVKYIHSPLGLDVDDDDFQPPDVGEEDTDDGDDGHDDNEDDDDDSEIEEFVEVQDYETILKKLSKDWLEIELSHNVSKVAANSFWDLGRKMFHNLFQAKELQNVRKKTPSFVHMRRRLHGRIVPPIHLEFAFQNKETTELTLIEDTKTPRGRFNPHEFTKVWELATVKVNSVTRVLFLFLCTFRTISNFLLGPQKTRFFGMQFKSS